MLDIDKELLRPNLVYYPPSGPISFSDDDIDEIFRSSSALQESGRAAPVPLEHRNDAQPFKLSLEDRLSDLTRHTVGRSLTYYRKPDGSFWSRLRILDPEAERKIASGAWQYVSPEITPVYCADGKVYRNVVTHIALTHQPVWVGQTPFHVPPGWCGDDGAVTPTTARLSLLSGRPLRLSLADVPPPEVLEILRFGYCIPGGANATGAWLRGAYYPTHVPQKALKEADPEELQELLRKLNARHGRRLPRDFAALLPAGQLGKEYDSQAHDVPLAHLALHDELPPFARPHPEGEPALVFEDPADGRSYLVTGHHLLQNPEEGASHPVLRLHAQDPAHARSLALGYHLASGTAHPDDLADAFLGGLPHEELHAALKDHGAEPDEKVWSSALEQLDQNGQSQRPAPESQDEAPEQLSLFGHDEGYDPAEHRWQHWLQAGFDDPRERAGFATVHAKDRPKDFPEFQARRGAFRSRFSAPPPSTGGPRSERMFDYDAMTKPEEEKKEPKEEGKEKKEGGEKKESSESKDDAPKAQQHKFQSLLKKLEKFGTKLDPEKVKSAEDLCSELETVLHAMEQHMDKGGMGANPAPAPQLDAQPNPGQFSLSAQQWKDAQQNIEALKGEILARDRKQAEQDRDVQTLVTINDTLALSLFRQGLEKDQGIGFFTKAEVEDFVRRAEQANKKQRFSVINPTQSPDMMGLLGEIKAIKRRPPAYAPVVQQTQQAQNNQPAPAVRMSQEAAPAQPQAPLTIDLTHLLNGTAQQGGPQVALPTGSAAQLSLQPTQNSTPTQAPLNPGNPDQAVNDPEKKAALDQFFNGMIRRVSGGK